jgi:hypothetical protein
VIGEENFPAIGKLEVGKFDSTAYDQSMKFLNVLKQYYLIRQNKAIQEKESMVLSLTSTPQKLEILTGTEIVIRTKP